MFYSLSPFAPENLVSRHRFGRPVPASACPLSTLRLNLELTRGIHPAFRHGAHFFIRSTNIGSSVSSLSGHVFTYRWRSPARVDRHRVSSPRVLPFPASSWTIFLCASLFPHVGMYWIRVKNNLNAAKPPEQSKGLGGNIGCNKDKKLKGFPNVIT